MSIIKNIVLLATVSFTFSLFAQQPEKRLSNKKAAKITVKKLPTGKKSKAVFIESQVKGSQEQPNVIYVMPWRGVEHPVVIKNSQQHILLPKFRPINPKTFRKQVKTYSQQRSLNHNDNKE